MPPVTVQQVADAAGVSRSTANKVLLGEVHLFREQTASKVLDAATTLGYRPNMNARGLRERRTFLLGTLLSSVNAPLAYELYGGIQHVAAEQLVAPVNFSCPDSDSEARAIQLCLDRQVDAILINTAPRTSTPENLALLAKIAGDGLPMVELFGRNLPDVPSIVADVRDAGYRATKELAESGLERIVYWSPLPIDEGTEATATNWFPLDMYRGYRQAMREAGLAPRIVVADLSAVQANNGASLDTLARVLLETQPDVQGIVSPGERMADAVSRVLLAEPGLAPSGCTQATFMAGAMPLGAPDRRVALRIPAREVGQAAARMAFVQIKGGSPDDQALPVLIEMN